MTPEEQSSLINVSYQFKLWCFFGCILCSFLVTYGLLGFIFQCTQRPGLAKAANCFLIMGYCFALGWVVGGTVLRYRESGVICAGDQFVFTDDDNVNLDRPSTYDPYMLRTGSLIATLVVSLYVFYGCVCLCSFCACCAVCGGYGRDM